MKIDASIFLDFLGSVLQARQSQNDTLPFYDFKAHILLLMKSARSLHGLQETHCNQGLSPKEERRGKTIAHKAALSAQALGFSLYVQGDPRGSPLYLLPIHITREEAPRFYSSGIAVPY